MQRILRVLPCTLALGLTTCSGAPETAAPTPAVENRFDLSLNQGFRPNPDFKPVTPAVGIKRHKLSLEGEVLVLEGDGTFVASQDARTHGITRDNQIAIVQEVLANYPDVFDTIQIYTTFTDAAHVGFAYYQGIRNEVRGIGTREFNSRTSWGLSPDGRLSGFSNMNSMLMWGNGSFNGLNNVEGFYHGVIAHELSHRWLFRMLFQDVVGMPNESLLGRDNSHWSVLAHSEGSIHDGSDWTDNGNDTFTNGGTDLGFAPLDLYAMGLKSTDEIADFFYIDEAMRDGNPVAKDQRLPMGAIVSGRRIDVTMDQVLAVMGPRDPEPRSEPLYYRAAFVLVTAPGESRTRWQAHLDVLQDIRADFPETWGIWTEGRSTMCTQISERCPEAIMSLADVEVDDGNDDLLGPGESGSLLLSIRNDGVGTVNNVTVTVASLDPSVSVVSGPIVVAAAPQGQPVALPMPVEILVADDADCGGTIPFSVTMSAADSPEFFAQFDVAIGTRTIRFDPLNEAPDWRVNPEGLDTAITGAWEHGEPEAVRALEITTQPGEDHTPGDAKLSFHTGLKRLETFSANDVDGGFTTLESPVFAVGSARDPSLAFFYWYVATDLSKNPPEELGDMAPLVVQASNDGGETYVELGRITTSSQAWSRASFRIRDAVVPTDRTRFRFVISDESAGGNVEAGIDDLEIVDFLGDCEIPLVETDAGVIDMPEPPIVDEGGCGCSTAPHSSANGIGLFFLSVLLLWRRRRVR